MLQLLLTMSPSEAEGFPAAPSAGPVAAAHILANGGEID